MNSKYEMKLSLNILKHLGINLYSNVSAVLTEVVANSWDADATYIDIKIDLTNETIILSDDGYGMDVEDMNNKYLTIGYDKRNDTGGFSPKGRKVMGRKGIGKLSLFSISEMIEVQSVKGNVKHGLIMSVPAIKETIQKGENKYCPAPMNAESIDIFEGTKITLTKLNTQRLSTTVPALIKRIARRFSIPSKEKFDIKINGKVITSKDRDDKKNVEYLWSFDGTEINDKQFPKKKNHKIVNNNSDSDPSKKISGWLGTVKKPSNLVSNDSGNMNSVVVHSRGRVVLEDMLSSINDGRLYSKYITGQIEADFLDDDELEDIATSDRQRLVEDDPRYIILKNIVVSALRQIAGEWSELRKNDGVESASTNHPIIKKWLGSLSDGSRPHAESIIANISKLEMDDKPEEKKVLYKHAIFAFERLRIKELSSELAAALKEGPEKLLPLLEKQDDLEATLYYEIAKSRLDVIDAFQGLIDLDEKEKVLQQYLYDHLWLLDPSWERAFGSEHLENSIKKEWGKIDARLTDAEEKGRRDIKYRTTAGKHLVIELKRASVKTGVMELVAQGKKYKTGLEKCLSVSDPAHTDTVEVIFVLGEHVKEFGEHDFIANQLSSINGRIVYYDQLINSAQRAYQEYTEKKADAAEIIKMIANL